MLKRERRKHDCLVHLKAILEDKEKALNFLRMEKWIFDSPGQAGRCFREFIKECYQENKLIKNELKIGDRHVDLKRVTMPVLNIYATGMPQSSRRRQKKI